MQIIFENRYRDDNGNLGLLTIDGTDFRVGITGVQAKSRKRFYSYKFKKPGLRYEVGICIKSGEICWLHGPFPAGAYNDLSIFRSALKNTLDEYEVVEADDGYQGEDPLKYLIPKFCNLFDNDEMQEARYRARSRHETCNKRFKQFHILRDTFRNDIEKHAYAFRAIVVLTQLSLKRGEPLFEVEYDDI